jgi:preprotein translocase subunit YajC
MSLFITDAMAATDAAAQPNGMFSFIMMGVIFVLFYFMLIRPQNKRAKEQRDLVNQLKKGDEIITSSGVLGKVLSVDSQYLKVSIAEGVDIAMQKQSVAALLPKGTLKSLKD